MSKMEVWSFVGAKGGVGKSVLCANIGIYLAKRNHKVILIDADPMGPSLATILGPMADDATIDDLSDDMSALMFESQYATRIENLRLASLVALDSDFTNYRARRERVFDALKKRLDYDFMLIDLGSRRSRSTLELLDLSRKKILVTSPDPTSIVNMYRLVEAMTRNENQKRREITLVPDTPRLNGETSMRELADSTVYLNGDNASGSRIKLIMNFVRARSDIHLGDTITNMCQKNWGVRIEYVGFAPFDNSVIESVRNRSPFALSDADSPINNGIKRIAMNIQSDYRLAGLGSNQPTLANSGGIHD